VLADCIDPKTRDFLTEVMHESASGAVSYNWQDIDDLWEALLHGRGCPACRIEFTDLLPAFKRIGISLGTKFRGELSGLRREFLRRKNSLLAESGGSASDYAVIVLELAMVEEDVFHFVVHGQEVLGFIRPSASPSLSEVVDGAGESSLSTCREFISSLEPDVQQFLLSVAYSRDLFRPVFERVRSESAEKGGYSNYVEDLRDGIRAGITNAELDPATLFRS
jgi:hypothetical protein